MIMKLDGVKAFDRSDRGLLIRLMAKYCGLAIPCRDAEGTDEAEVQRLTETIDFLLWLQIILLVL